jgi:hypothetical protein
MDEESKEATGEALNDAVSKTTLNSEPSERKPANRRYPVIAILLGFFVAGYLEAIGVPNFIGAQKKAKSGAFKGAMRTVQIAAESYATDSGGAYGKLEQITNYMPGGSNQIGGAPGKAPENIVELPSMSGAEFQAWLEKPRNLTPNRIYYCRLDGGGGYAITGTTDDGYISGTGDFPIVLSNQ